MPVFHGLKSRVLRSLWLSVRCSVCKGADRAWGGAQKGPANIPPSELVIKPGRGRSGACVRGNARMSLRRL